MAEKLTALEYYLKKKDKKTFAKQQAAAQQHKQDVQNKVISSGKSNFVWSKDYIDTAKKNATDRTNTGISFADRYNDYITANNDFRNQSKQYFEDGYNTSGDYIRKRISDLNQEAGEMIKQLENNKADFVSTYGEAKYNDIYKSLKDDIRNYKKSGKGVLAKRDVINVFKNDKDYKDDDARKTAYDDYINISDYYGTNLNYKQVQQELDSLKNDKLKAVKDPYYSKKIKWLEDYGKNYGYKDNESFDDNIKDINSRINELKQYGTNITVADKKDEKFKEYWYNKHKDTIGSITESQKNEHWNNLSTTDLQKDWDEYKGVKNSDEIVDEISKLESRRTSIQSKKTLFENYNKIISKYDVNLNYDKLPSDISKENKTKFIEEYNKSEAFKNLGHKNNQDEIEDEDLDILNEKERKILNSYLSKNQTDKAIEFLKDIRNSFDYGARAQQLEYQKIKDAPWYEQVGHSVLSIPASVIGGVTGAVSDIATKISGEDLNPYDQYHELSNYAETTRGAVSDTINENAGSGFSWLYNTVMGIGDFAAELLLTKGIGKATGLGIKGTSSLMQGIVSSGAYTSTTMQAKKDGLDDKTAMALGFASGAIEWATEKYSIEALMNIKPGDKIWKSIAKNFVTEGSEEGASTIANFFVNMALAGEKSDYQQAIQNYIEYGYTESEAKKKAYLDLGKQVVSDVAAGALMGGVLGAGTAISSNIAKKNVLSGEYAKAYGQAALISDNAQAIIDNAKEFGIDTQNAEEALAELDIIEEEFDKNPTSKELHDQWQEQFEKTADTLSELELYIEQSGGQTELDITEQEFQSENYNSPLESRETGINEFDEEVERQADIAEASDIIENDLHDRGVTNQDRIVNNFKAKTIANEVSKLHDGKIKVDGDIRTDKISRRVQAFYDSKGLETVWFKNSYVKDKNGNFTKAQINGFTNGNKIYLNSDVPIERQIFKHEYHHTLENAKGFENYSKRLENSKAFKDWILNKAKKLNATGTYNNQYRAVLNNYISMYGVATKLSNTQAKNEAFADFMAEELFSGKNFNDTMNKLEEAFEDKNGFQKFIDTIKDIVSKIKEALGGSASIEALERNIIKLQKQIDSGKTVQNKNTENNNGVKYEINPDFENDIKTWDRNGKSDEESFILGSTGDVLQGLGARENDIYINGSKINTILREHPEMSLDVIKKIPEILENPILVLSSKNKVNNNTRMVMFGRINAENGKPVLCVLDLIPKENKIVLDDMQKAVSAYSKTNSAEDIKSFFERSEVLYTSKNKKITTNLLTRVGFSMPTDLLKSGYIGSITYGNENVNIKGKPFNEVFSYDTNNSISENAENDTNNATSFSIGEKTDTEYMSAVKNGDTETAQRLVDEAAKQAGFNSPRLYHGTSSFGFTEFNLNKMDDKRSIFLTSSKEIASTYSGVDGIRKISDASNIDLAKISGDEIANLLNQYKLDKRHQGYSYEYYDPQKVDNLVKSVKSECELLEKKVDKLLNKYADGSNEAYYLNQIKSEIASHNTLLNDTLKYLLNETDVFINDSKFVSNFIKNFEIAKYLTRSNVDNGFILEKSDNNRSRVVEEREITKALDIIKADINSGNYSLYAKLGKTLTVDCKGRKWDEIGFDITENKDVKRLEDIKNKYEVKVADKSDTDKENDALMAMLFGYNLDVNGEYYEIINKTDNSSVNVDNHEYWNTYDEAKEALELLVDEEAGRLHRTREISEYAQEQGYDSVIFKNLIDNGGNNAKVKQDTIADIYIIFNPNNVKSADAVTYDDNGNVIPLSERFDDSKNDIRFSISEDVDNEIIDRYTEKQYNNFGWIAVNEVLTKNEWSQYNNKLRETLSSKTPRNINGEHVMTVGEHSSDITALVYVKGTAGNPIVTKVVRLNKNISNTENISMILEELIQRERQGYREPYAIIENYAEQGIFVEYKRQDYASLREFKEQRKGNVSKKDYSDSETGENRTRSAETNSADSKAGLDKSAFSIDDELETLNEKYGTIKKGANAERDIDVPKKTSDNMVTSLTVRSILEKGNIDGETLERIKTDVINEARSHKSYSDKQALDYAKRHLENGDAEIMWNEAIKGKVTKNDIALGEALIEMYANSTELSDTEKADKILNLTAELCEVGTRLGQAVQAFSLLKKMGGVGRLYYLQKTVNTLNKDLEKKYKGKKQVKIGEAEAEFLANAKTEQEVTEAAQEIMKSVGEQVPSTFLDKWNAWRYLSMLGNPRTHIRNLVGNAVFVPAVEIKNAFGTAMEHIFIRDTSKRTKAIKISKGTVSFANKDFKLMSDYISSGGKYNDNTEIEDAKQIFKFKPLEAFRKLNFKALEAEDMVFLKYHYVRAMSQALTAKKIDVNNISESQLQQVREYAVNEAWKATYRDASAVANAITRIGKTNALSNILVEGVLPFKKTPINILKRGIEYSPIGLIKTLSKGAVDLKKGKINASQFVDGISSGLTGTGIMALGMLLSSMGIAIGGFGGDDDEWFRQLNGEQEYSLQFGDFSYTIDWAAPACIPFFIGVEMQKMLSGENENFTAAFVNSLDGALEPITNLSMLQGINDTLNTIKWEDSPMTSIVTDSVTSYFMQALPTLSGQFTRTVDEYRRKNYVDKNSAVPEWLQKIGNTASGKLFNFNGRNKYVDAWGNYDITKGIANRIVQNMLSPGYVSTVNYDSVNNEIARLYNAKGNKLVLPDSVDTEIKIDGETKYLTADEYEKYQTQAGQNAYKYIDELIKTSTYKYADDDTKIEMITDIYSYAENKAKTTVSDYKLSDSEAKLDMYLQRNVSLDEYFNEKYKNEQDEDEKITLDNEKVNEILDDVENSPTYQNAGSKKKMSMVDAVVKYVKDSQKNNLSKSDEIIKEVEDSGNNISGLIINKGAVSGKKNKKDKLNAIKKSGADSESKYISMAYEYLTGRKVTYNGKYLYFSDLTAAQKYKYISSNKSSIKAGLYEDYGV